MSVSKKEIVLVLLASLTVGLLFIGPPLAIKHNFESQNKEFILAQFKTYRDEANIYIPRAREIYDGHFPPADLSLDQRGTTPLNALPSVIFALFIAIFKGDINNAYLGAQFIFSAIIFILLYLIGRIILKSKPWAFLFAIAGVLTPFLTNVFSFDFKNDIGVLRDFTVKQFIPFVRTQIDKLRLTRIDYPLLVYPIYFWGVAAFLAFWRKPGLRNAILAAIPAGLLAYTYFHVWVYWTIVIGVLFIGAFLFYKKDKLLVKNFSILLIIFAALLIPYFINYFTFKSLPASEDISYRIGLVTGHDIGIVRENFLDYLVYLVLAILIIATHFIRRSNESEEQLYNRRRKGCLFLSLLVAAVIAWNIQVIIGHSAAPTKWRYPISLALYLIVFSLIYEWIKMFSK